MAMVNSGLKGLNEDISDSYVEIYEAMENVPECMHIFCTSFSKIFQLRGQSMPSNINNTCLMA